MTKYKAIIFIFFSFLFYESKAQLYTQTDLFVGEETVVYTDFDIGVSSTGNINNNGTVILEGNFINDGLVSSTSTSILRFQGTNDVNFKAEGNTASEYGIVEMGKMSANVTSLSDGTIISSLDFNGENTKLILNNNTVTLSPTATAIGYDANEYVQADGTGFLAKDLSAVGSFFYPVGDIDEYSPINSTVSGILGTNPSVKVNVRDVKHPNMLAESTAYLTRYWNVEATNITDYSNSLAGTYIVGASDVFGTENIIDGSSYNSTEWTFTDGAIDVASSIVTGTTSDLSVDFTGQYSALPLELISFVAVPNEQNDVNLYWTTISELNVSHFTIERSYDAVKWYAIAKKEANNLIKQNDYNYTDYYSAQTNKSGRVYYRLKSVDFDGTFAYSSIKAVELFLTDIRIVSGIHSSHVDIYTDMQGRFLDIRLFDLSGRLVQTLRADEDFIRLENVPRGYFVLTLSDAYGIILHTTKIVKF